MPPPSRCLSQTALAFIATTFLSSAFAAQPAAITPREPIALFNGKDLSNFTTWTVRNGTKDPERVFTVVDAIDGAPAIRSSGQDYGGIITRDRYTHYRLVVEYRWGVVTWEPRKNKTRDSGVLLHCQGEPGNNLPDFRSPWMRSIEYQIIEGGTGDIIIVGGYDRGNPEIIFPTMKATVTPGTRRWNPNGTLGEFGKGKNRTDWGGKAAEWKDVLGNFVPPEKPTGEWNRLEAICDGANLTYFLNGTKVNEAKDASLREGQLLFQSEGAEVYFRKIELLPLGK